MHLDNDRHVLLVCLGAFPQIFGRRKCSAAAGGASNPTHCLQSEPTYRTSRARDVQSIRSDQVAAAQMVAASHIKAVNRSRWCRAADPIALPFRPSHRLEARPPPEALSVLCKLSVLRYFS